MKPYRSHRLVIQLSRLKSKEPRLRDWNRKHRSWECTSAHLKSKEPRLRDWNAIDTGFNNLPIYQLEIKRTSITRLKLDGCGGERRFRHRLKSKEPRLRDWNEPTTDHNKLLSTKTWNQKNLDYEIETVAYRIATALSRNLKSKEPRLRDWNGTLGHLLLRKWILEIKRTSITRLKLDFRYNSLYKSIATWNQKNLDYEIETGIILS